jgi:hypothetical protein
MNCFEGYATFLDIGRDRVDDGVGPAKSGGNRGWVAHIGPKDGNIMQAGGPEDTASLVGMSNRDAHRRPVGRQTFNGSQTEEARPPENDHRGHAVSPPLGQ